MIVNSVAYGEGRKVADVQLEDISDVLKTPGCFVWIGLHEPDWELLRRVQKEFGLHDLAVEDAGRAHQRPKLEEYGSSLFVVLRTVQLIDGKMQFGETHVSSAATTLSRSVTALRSPTRRCANAVRAHRICCRRDPGSCSTP